MSQFLRGLLPTLDLEVISSCTLRVYLSRHYCKKYINAYCHSVLINGTNIRLEPFSVPVIMMFKACHKRFSPHVEITFISITIFSMASSVINCLKNKKGKLFLYVYNLRQIL